MLSEKMLTNVEAAWVAAVVDCEGTLSIHTPWNKERHNRNLQYVCRVHMTDEAVITRLKDLCGGSSSPVKRRNPKHRDSWRWDTYANGLRGLLPQLLPYLIVKKRHAEIMIGILNKNSRGPGKQMSFNELRPLLYELRGLQKCGFPSDIDKICATFREANYPDRILRRDPITRRFVCK
jgi:hypothetical protein